MYSTIPTPKAQGSLQQRGWQDKWEVFCETVFLEISERLNPRSLITMDI